jgi:hypothetical protein
MVLLNLPSIGVLISSTDATVLDLGDWLCQLLGICA